jgi:hypothetical protein
MPPPTTVSYYCSLHSSHLLTAATVLTYGNAVRSGRVAPGVGGTMAYRCVFETGPEGPELEGRQVETKREAA